MDETNEVGDNIDKSPAENDDDLVCDLKCLVLGEVGNPNPKFPFKLELEPEPALEFSVALISILPPPKTARLSNPDLSAFRVLAWSGVGRAPGTGVINTVPVSWA